MTTPKLEPPKDEPYINGRDFIGPKHEWADELREAIEAKIIFMRQHNQIGNQGWNETLDEILALIKLQQEALLIWVHDNRYKKSFHKELDAKLDKLRLEL